MPIDSIKKWLFQKELKKPIEIATEKSNAIGVFVDFMKEEDLSQLSKLIQQQGGKQEDVCFLLFANQKEAIVSDVPSYCLKDIKWAGFPQSEAITKFISRNYKRFYYLSPKLDAHQYYVLSKIKADFKAGIYSKGIETILDLTIDNDFQSSLESLKEIHSTIAKLTTKNNGQK
jgi:hypothetical protein